MESKSQVLEVKSKNAINGICFWSSVHVMSKYILKKLCSTVEFLTENYITHDFTEKITTSNLGPLSSTTPIKHYE